LKPEGFIKNETLCMQNNHEKYMQLALDLALKGTGQTSPNPMVGAVLVKDGQVVGRGYHAKVGGPHAEVNAIADAGSHARGATLYVSLEPCNHTGRTPPCTEQIIAAGIGRVVVAMADPNPGVAGGGSRYLRKRGIPVIEGVLADRAKRLIEDFVKHVTTGRPFVIVKWAATLDGRIATRTGDSKWITGQKARAFVHTIRHRVDAILVGVETVRVDDPSLTTRLEGQAGIDPARIILDTNLSIDPAAKMLHQPSSAPTYLVIGPHVDRRKRAALESETVHLIEAPLRKGSIDLGRLMKRLGAMNMTSLMIEGGSRVIAAALAAKIVDKVLCFYAPKILGGDDGVPICKGPGPSSMAESLIIGEMTMHRFGDDFMIEGYPQWEDRPD
jgi:diaminohydroxyphosphoribosylaminopyrimidine deaminase/5-amino-6-(5-phosphoribosylamino)uracil reductase